jgi:uncharacterized protein involved in exopolysaccharide biosynthesis
MEKLGVSQDQLVSELRTRMAELKSYENRLVKTGSADSPQLVEIKKEIVAIQEKINKATA